MTTTGATATDVDGDILVKVFQDGDLLVDVSLDDVRERAKLPPLEDLPLKAGPSSCVPRPP